MIKEARKGRRHGEEWVKPHFLNLSDKGGGGATLAVVVCLFKPKVRIVHMCVCVFPSEHECARSHTHVSVKARR